MIAEAPLERLERSWAETGGFVAALNTVHHKRIGIRYLVTASVFFALGGVEALGEGDRAAGPNQALLSPEEYDQLFSMHGITMIFLFVTPIPSSTATSVRSVKCPRSRSAPRARGRDRGRLRRLDRQLERHGDCRGARVRDRARRLAPRRSG